VGGEKAGDARGALSEQKGQQHTERREGTVAGDEESSDVEEDGMHWG
jgi:hypothetical protein